MQGAAPNMKPEALVNAMLQGRGKDTQSKHAKVFVSIKNWTIAGFITGICTAGFLMSLEYIKPFSPHVNAFAERMAFKLCPFYILGFSNLVSNEVELVALTILGNGIVYGIAFGAIAALLSFRRRSLHDADADRGLSN
jgi:hypothetical protein